jgi:phosphoribosylformimino-5-aminoimidazole carboxamide ribotide isomerase
MGATFLHLVHLDGAKAGHSLNLDAVKRIIEEVKIDCELGGGIRSIAQIEEILSIGVKRVILGSIALNLDFVKEAVAKFGSEKIVIGIDCKNMKVSTHGWLDTTDIDAIEFANKLKKIGIKTIIFTDIAKDGTLEGINVAQTKKMIDETGLDIVASGGAKSLNDIKNAKEIGAYGIILGKSIYSNAINLEEAIQLFEE